LSDVVLSVNSSVPVSCLHDSYLPVVTHSPHINVPHDHNATHARRTAGGGGGGWAVSLGWRSIATPHLFRGPECEKREIPKKASLGQEWGTGCSTRQVALAVLSAMAFRSVMKLSTVRWLGM
jgi:hypothetical protein